MKTSDYSSPDSSSARIGPDTSDAPLVKAIESYAQTRDAAAVRAAIARWCNHVEQTSLEPQTVLIQFKHVLDRLGVTEQSNYDQRVADRREMILMCIQEFYREVR